MPRPQGEPKTVEPLWGYSGPFSLSSLLSKKQNVGCFVFQAYCFSLVLFLLFYIQYSMSVSSRSFFFLYLIFRVSILCIVTGE